MEFNKKKFFDSKSRYNIFVSSDFFLPIPDNTIIEISPIRRKIIHKISQRIFKMRGAALIVDYGSLSSGFGDTLQAVGNHCYQNPLKNPGEYDLTSHVDFLDLCKISEFSGCHHSSFNQRDFLINIGLFERAGILGANKNIDFQNQIVCDVNRLVSLKEMGNLFKVLCIADPETKMDPFVW